MYGELGDELDALAARHLGKSAVDVAAKPPRLDVRVTHDGEDGRLIEPIAEDVRLPVKEQVALPEEIFEVERDQLFEALSHHPRVLARGQKAAHVACVDPDDGVV